MLQNIRHTIRSAARTMRQAVRAMCSTPRQMRPASRLLAAVAAVVALGAHVASCSNIDCPLNNNVRSNYGFYNSVTKAAAPISDTVTVIAAGIDSVIYNRGVNIQKLSLPMSYARTVDTLIVEIAGRDARASYTLCVNHTNVPHFESVDCGAAMFHVIKGVELSADAEAPGVARIDSVTIANPNVNYNAKENLRIYFTAR